MRVRVRGICAGLTAVGTALVLSSPEIVAQSTDQRTISIYNIHTKETVSVVYRRNGHYVPAAMKQVNHVMRDWRQNEATEMEPGLVDIIWEIHAELGSKEPIHLISGYRSRRTNDGLRESTGGQAKNSRHILGKAADIHFPDVPIKRLRYSALIRERGGVGYYPTSAIPFVHVDTDRVRHWPPMPRYELALLFPNGQSKHVPSDGQPITKEDVRVAQSRHRDLAVQIAEFFEVRHKPGAHPDPNRTVLASLSGPHPVQPPAPRQPTPVAAPPQPSPQLASLTGGLSIPLPSMLTRKRSQPAETVALPPVAAPPVTAPQVPAQPASQIAAAPRQKPAPRDDALGALMAREVALLDARERKAAAAAKTSPRSDSALTTASAPLAQERSAPDRPARVRVASADPAAGISDPIGEKITGEILKGWPSGYAQAPAFDEEHPEELSYRPFAIGPILTQHAGDDHPVLARLHHPETAGRFTELLDEPERLFPLSFRPGKQIAELMWASQFNGAKVGSDTLTARLKSGASGLVIQRQVATMNQ